MKKYECQACGVRQKIKEQRLEEREINDKRNPDTYGPCAKCNRTRLMKHVEQRPLSLGII